MTLEKPLSAVADVQTGYPFRGKIKEDPDGSHLAIQSRDINRDFSLNLAGMARFNMPPGARSGSKQLQANDVLVMSRTDKPYAIQIPPEFPPSVAHTSFYAIRIHSHKELEPSFLTLLLNSTLLQNRLQSLIKGSSIPYIRIEDLRQLAIPLPTLKKQRQIIQLQQAFQHEACLHRKLEAVRKELIGDLLLTA
jgi:hypothetical protein